MFLLSGCRSTINDVCLNDLDWKLEFVSDLEGSMLVSGNSKDNLADVHKNVNCICDKNSNITITDETDGKSWSGKYSLELSDKDTKSYKLIFSDNVILTGILGKRQYVDGKIAHSFTIYTNDKVISFLSEEI